MVTNRRAWGGRMRSVLRASAFEKRMDRLTGNCLFSWRLNMPSTFTYICLYLYQSVETPLESLFQSGSMAHKVDRGQQRHYRRSVSFLLANKKLWSWASRGRTVSSGCGFFFLWMIVYFIDLNAHITLHLVHTVTACRCAENPRRETRCALMIPPWSAYGLAWSSPPLLFAWL